MKLTAEQAKHTALRALGFSASGPKTLDQTLETLGLFQLDTVNVFERAHLMPAFSRIGAFPKAEFEAWAFGPAGIRQAEEYWAHCAALIPKADYGLFEFRRNEYRKRESIVKMLTEQKQLVRWVISEIETNGPMLVSQFEHEQNKRRGDWWGWSEIKIILERLWFIGELVSDGRQRFSRRYALAHQAGIVHGTELSEHEQRLKLIELAAKRLGVATLDDIADYYRFYPTEARPLVKELVASKVLVETEVTGWTKPAYLHHQTEVATGFDLADRPVRLVSPFDPLVFRRERAKRLFDFDYLIEIYVPEAKRQYGYYTLPILHQDSLMGRVDLKHERKQNVLEVRSLWQEPGIGKQELTKIGKELTRELELAANWIGADRISFSGRGNWEFGR